MRQQLPNFGSWSASTARKSLTRDLESLSLQIVDLGIGAIIFVAPFVFGGRHAVGRCALIALCACVSIAWCCHNGMAGTRRWTTFAANWIFVAAIVVLVLQMVPMPSGWTKVLSPRTAELLPLWTAPDIDGPVCGEWRTLSLAPEATKLSLATLVGYCLLFITVSQRVESDQDVARMLRWIALSAILMAAFGLVQYFTSNGKFFWFYEHPYATTSRVAKGSFTCRNHFADFLALGLAALVGTIHHRQSAARECRRGHDWGPGRLKSSYDQVGWGFIGGAGVVTLAILLSLSRGGTMAMAVVVVITTAVYYRAQLLLPKNFAVGVGVVIVGVVGVLSLHGYENVVRRIDDFTTGGLQDLDVNNGRRLIWAANARAIANGWQTGTGAGSHRFIYRKYMPNSLSREFTHAENGYLQVVTENGLPGALLILAAIACCAAWCWRAMSRTNAPSVRISIGAISAGLAASFVHSTVDFVWYVPACVSMALIMAACARRLAWPVVHSEPAMSPAQVRAGWLVRGILVSAAGVWSVVTLIGPARAELHWDRYCLAANANQKAQDEQVPLEDAPIEQGQQAQWALDTMIAELQQVLHAHPTDARAHLRLASKYLQLFELKQSTAANSMSVTQIRDAATASGFATSEALRQWLQQAFGDNSALLYLAYHHACAGVEQCPLQGKGYLMLAKLCFLKGEGPAAVEAYLAQAIAVRPYDGEALFEAGMQQLVSGRMDAAIDYWVEAYSHEGEHQEAIVQVLAGRIPAEQFLTTFKPTWATLWDVWKRYRAVGSNVDQIAVLRYARQTATVETAAAAANGSALIWRLLAAMYREVGHHEAALASLRSGLAADPNDLRLRYLLGRTLLDLGYPAEAEAHFRWCLSRHPDQKGVQSALLEAVNQRTGGVRTAGVVTEASTL